MKWDVAQLLARNLVGRLKSDGSGFNLPEGRVSALEVEALEVLAGSSPPEVQSGAMIPGDELPLSVAAETTPSDTPQLAAAKSSVSLDLSALEREGPDEKDIRICLDFGTAMSKAWATGRSVEETIPLVLGRPAGIGERLSIPSSIFISKSGRVYLGATAETQHRQELEAGRQRFDNLKRMLSDAEVGQDLDDVLLPPAIDPTDSGLTRGDLLVLYLAWLTDLSCSALNDIAESGGLTLEEEITQLRYLRRRFAIPCFEHAIDEQFGGKARAKWAQGVMERAILRAQVVADTLRGSWNDLTVERIRDILLETRKLDISRFSHLLAAVPSVREPIAAGASRFEELLSEGQSRSRQLLFVVDAGAGTTDFAVFQVFHDPDREERIRYALVAPTVRMSRVAGNAVDEVLRPLVLKACGIDPANGSPRSDEDFSLIKTDLAAQIRDLKQLLFSDSRIDVSLRPNAKGVLELEALIEDATFQDLGGQLLDARRSILEGLFEESFLQQVRLANQQAGQPMRIYVLLTGGSSTLPIVQSLAEGELDINKAKFRFERVKNLPDWVENLPRDVADLVGSAYPQSAVAIGGSAPALPTEIRDLSSPVTPPPPGKRRLERYQVTGVG